MPADTNVKDISIRQLAQIIKAEPTTNPAAFTGVSTDSRTIRPGNCFFAIAGQNFDGHDCVADAFAKGAACAVVSKTIDSGGEKVLKVVDTLKALGDLAKEYRRRMSFKLVAITGSVGKTTTRRIAHHVLSCHFQARQAQKNFNNDIGLPLTLLDAEPQDQIVIAELGSSYPGEIAYLSRIAAPDIAVVTNVCIAHLAGFGNLDTILREKLSITQGLRPDGILIANADFERLLSAAKARNTKLTTFGFSEASDIQARDLRCTGAAGSFTVDGCQICLPLPGRGNVDNALAAWAICRQFGLNIEDFTQALKTLHPVPMRAELLQIGTLTVINDCYNANPASMKNALDILTRISASKNRRQVFICGGMAELGEHSRKLHDELGRQIADARVELLLALGEFAQTTAQAAKTNASHTIQAECFEHAAAICDNLETFVKHDDVVLVKGSRAAGLETVVAAINQLGAQAPLLKADTG